METISDTNQIVVVLGNDVISCSWLMLISVLTTTNPLGMKDRQPDLAFFSPLLNENAWHFGMAAFPCTMSLVAIKPALRKDVRAASGSMTWCSSPGDLEGWCKSDGILGFCFDDNHSIFHLGSKV